MGQQLDLVLRARRVVTPEGEVAGEVGVRDGRVVAVTAPGHEPAAAEVVEFGDDVVLLPGLVDSHVHVNEPGRTEWEGFATATRAAAAGGVTTIVDMPLNSIPPTVDPGALAAKRQAAAGRCHVDVGFWGGAVPGNLAELRGLHAAGVFGLKSFLLPSGVEEFGHLDADQFRRALHAAGALEVPVLVHAEDARVIQDAPHATGPRYRDFLASRPPEAEYRAIAQVIRVTRQTGCRVHLLHLSSAGALPLVAAARAEGVRLSVETCPHYLTFTAEEIPDGATAYKCCPPIRQAANREALWAGLAGGQIDGVVSDHSPSTPTLKRPDSGDFGAAWGGISSLQLGLAAVWTQARRRGIGLAEVARWMSQRPADWAGLRHKGRIAPGYDADFCALAPEETFVVDPRALHHRHPVTPYAGRTLAGVVRGTWLRGVRVDVNGEPRGRLLTRGDA